MKNIIIIAIIGFLGIYFYRSFSAGSNAVQSIYSASGAELHGSSNVVFLDVRTVEEHRAKAIPGSQLIPVQELESRVNELQPVKDKKIVVYCRSGNRSGKAANILQKHGFNVVNLSGGMMRWNGPSETGELLLRIQREREAL